MSTFSTQILETIQYIASRWEQADKAALRHLFALLSAGKPVSPFQFAKIAKKDIPAAEEALQMGRSDRDAHGNVIGLFGFALQPSLHRLMIEDVALFSCCAMVAQMAPFLVGKPASIESIDPTNNKVVKIIVSPNSIQSVEPKDAVATFIATNQEDVLRDVSSAFCSHVRHFINRRTAEEFTSLNPKRYIVDIDQLHRIASQVYDLTWSHAI
jgi:alkylmercury lyase